MGVFTEQIRGFHRHMAILDDSQDFLGEAWEPPTPSYKVPQSQFLALSQLMQLNGTYMLQLSRSLAKGNIRGARVKLRRIYHRMDAALRQMDQMERKSKRGR